MCFINKSDLFNVTKQLELIYVLMLLTWRKFENVGQETRKDKMKKVKTPNW